MRIIKQRDESTWDAKPHRMHGSSALWSLHRSQGKLMRMVEKPRGSRRSGGRK